MTARKQYIDPEFEIYPAIDLHEGRVVRLIQGNLAQETKYSQNPASIAEKWCAAGAHWLHIVNLDGAFGNKATKNRQALAEIVKIAGSFGVCTQLGGGIRDTSSLQSALDLGINRVIIGTSAVSDPTFVETSLQETGAAHVAVGLDVIDGEIFTHGWRYATGYTALELGQKMRSFGLEWAIYTNIARDGMQTGADFTYAKNLASLTRLKIILSGGVKSINDISDSLENGLAGLIIGKALYEGQIDLQMAVNYVNQAKSGDDSC